LATATGQRDGAFTELDDIPAFQRFDSNTQKFLDTDGKNVRSGGAIVPTPQQARTELAGKAEELQELHTELIRKVTALKGGIDDFGTLNLPERLSRDIIANARDVLQDRIDELEPLTPEARLEKVRDATLDVLAARATVQGFGSLSPQGLFLSVTGSAGPFASSSLPAAAADLQSDVVGPYALFLGQDKLTFELEGADAMVLQLPGSFVPFLQAVARGPFEVFAGANQFTISLTGATDVAVTLSTLSPTLTDPWNIVEDINTAVGAQPLEAVLDFIPIKTSQAVDIDASGSSGDADFILDVAIGTWSSLGVVVGDYIIVKDPTATQNELLYEIDLFTDAQTAETTLISTGSAFDELDKVVPVGANGALMWTVQVQASSSQAALDGKWVLRMDDTEAGTLSNIGIFPGSEVRARKTTAQDLEENINTNLSASLAGVARLEATSTFVQASTSLGRTNPTDPSLLVLYAFRGRGDITSGGVTATFSLPTLAGELVATDLLVIRETDTEADVGLVGIIDSVVGTTVIATFSSTVLAATDVLVEGGPSLTSLVDQTLRISEEGPQDGDYTVESVAGLDLTLGRTVALTADIGGQPFFFTDVSVGSFRLDFQTLDTTLSSSLEIQTGTDDASGEFLNTVPTTVVGTTPYFQLPETPSNLEAGDSLELHNTAAATPDVVRVIKQVLDNDIIELETPIDVTQAALLFTTSSPVPFGRIRKQVKQNFDDFQDAAEDWLDLDNNDLLRYFRQLDAFLNALIVNTNPTVVQVNDAVLHLQSLSATLATLQTALDAYSASRVVQVDNLITAYEQKGADRAKTILLEGRFTDFFGLTQDGLSTAGYVQGLVKDISRQDLPVRKDTRHTLEALPFDNELASWDDTDFEFTVEDVDPADDIDIPGEGDVAPNIPIP
jgi:hypothetical protein